MTPEALVQARLAAGMTQRRLAKEIGVGYWTLSRIERGVRPAPPVLQSRIIEVLGDPSKVAPDGDIQRIPELPATGPGVDILARKAAEKEEWLEQVRLQHEADRNRRWVA